MCVPGPLKIINVARNNKSQDSYFYVKCCFHSIYIHLRFIFLSFLSTYFSCPFFLSSFISGLWKDSMYEDCSLCSRLRIEELLGKIPSIHFFCLPPPSLACLNIFHFLSSRFVKHEGRLLLQPISLYIFKHFHPLALPYF